MSDLHEGDQRLIAGVVNRMGTHELTDALENIFARLEAIETEIFPPEEAATAEAGVGEAETVPPLEEGTPQAPAEEGESPSSNPPIEPESAPTT